MKIALITGYLAKDIVRHFSKNRDNTEVIVMPIQVAALMNSHFLVKELRKKRLDKVDMILTPGLVKGNLSIVENIIGIPIFRGPNQAADLASGWASAVKRLYMAIQREPIGLGNGISREGRRFGERLAICHQGQWQRFPPFGGHLGNAHLQRLLELGRTHAA